MKTISELEAMEYYSRQKYIDDLSKEDRIDLLQRINKELSSRRTNYKSLREYEDSFCKTHNTEAYKLESLKSQVSHKYRMKDLVVLKDNYEIVEISDTIGVKQYKVKRSVGRHSYTLDKVHENDILSHIKDFDIHKVLNNVKQQLIQIGNLSYPYDKYEPCINLYEVERIFYESCNIPIKGD